MGPRPLLHADPGPATLGHMGPLRGPSQTEVLTACFWPHLWGGVFKVLCKLKLDLMLAAAVRQT